MRSGASAAPKLDATCTPTTARRGGLCDKWRSDLERLSLVGVRAGVHSRKSHYGSTESIPLVNFSKIDATARDRGERQTSTGWKTSET